MRVLLACMRNASHTGPPDLGPVDGVDWDSLLRDAERHGVATLLHTQLARLPVSPLPADCKSLLERLRRENVQRGLRLTAVLIELMELFGSSGLTALPYKGPTLSAQIYGDPALREAVDLDILLPERDARKAHPLLMQHGFSPIRPYGAAIQNQLFCYRAEVGLVREEVLVELQWRLAPRYFSVDLDIPAIASRATTVSLGGRQTPVMSAEDNLLALSIHAAKHLWSSLKWVVDIDLFLRRNPALDRLTLMERSRRSGTLRILLTTLALAQELLATPLPTEVMKQIQADREVPAIVGTALALVAAGQEPTEVQHHRLMLRLRERLMDRLTYLARLSYQPTESEWDAIALPAGLQWLYFGVRAGRVSTKALGSLFA